MEVLEKARSDEVPWSLVPSVERLSTHLLPGMSVLITSSPAMDYMVSWGPGLATIYLPNLHRSNGFLHVLIGHELFHPIVTEFLDRERAKAKPKLHAICQSHLKKLGFQPDLFFQQRLDDLLNYALQQWEKGIMELMCDMGAASVFGPAALWTLSGFAATQDMNSPPSGQFQFYPPWRMRIRVVNDLLRTKENAEALLSQLGTALRGNGQDAHADSLDASFAEEVVAFSPSDLAAEPVPEMRQLTLEVYQLVEGALPDASDFVIQKASNVPKRWHETLNEIPTLLERLSLHVPPSELLETQKQESKAASMTGIVTACWLERLRLEKAGDLDLGSFRRLCRLMLKAIEDSELKNNYAEWASIK
ncbi:hypothetical protein U8335_10695 [Roseiconus lacunae]|uniref:hypothetical protein n=1 Tax=Roseiconus lacunae TaxID=2605694 RepID=UPI003085530E|nr:hypothetical protein U8335_10695 [Stieleria sp. HD01]